MYVGANQITFVPVDIRSPGCPSSEETDMLYTDHEMFDSRVYTARIVSSSRRFYHYVTELYKITSTIWPLMPFKDGLESDDTVCNTLVCHHPDLWAASLSKSKPFSVILYV